jgi:hypothetical protein
MRLHAGHGPVTGHLVRRHPVPALVTIPDPEGGDIKHESQETS